MTEAQADADSVLQTLAQQRFGPLREAERKLLLAAALGEDANCGPEEAERNAPENDPANADTWGQERTIRTSLLQWLCINRTAREQVHPFGIRVFAARMEGGLDLSFVTVPFPLAFMACAWPSGLLLRNTKLPELDLTKCRIGCLPAETGPGEAQTVAIMARGMQTTGYVFLQGGFEAEGEVNLERADIGGSLVCNDSNFRNAGRSALKATGINVRGGVLLRNNFHAEGAVWLFGAEIGGNLECDGGNFQNAGTALNIEGAKIRGAVYLRNNFRAEGEVRLFGAEIGGTFECDRGSFRNETGVALSADGAKIGRAALFRNLYAEGQVRLFGAEIGGNLACDGGTFKNPKGAALNAEGTKIRGAVYLRNNFQAEGEVRLFGAEIGGSLECDRAGFKNGTDVALNAQGAKIDRSVLLRNDFSAEGKVWLFGAVIGGNLECDRGTFKNANGVALTAEGTNIRGAVLLRERFHAEGEVRLFGTKIGGSLACDGGSFNNSAGPALNTEGAKIGSSILLRNNFQAEGEVRLFGAEIGGNLECGRGTFKNAKGVALNAEGMKIGGAVYLRNNLNVEGQVRLLGMKVEGSLECGRSSFKNGTGVALLADGAKIGRVVLLRDNFQAEGEVRLFGAEIGGNLECGPASFKNANGVALNAIGAKIGRSILLRNNFEAEGEVLLSGATVGGDLIVGGDPTLGGADLAAGVGAKLSMQRTDVKGALNIAGMRTAKTVDLKDTSCTVLVDGGRESWPPQGELVLDGLVYRRIDIPRDPSFRLDWLRRQLPHDDKARRGLFRPQPYRQLASVLRAQGLDAEAKAILIGLAQDRRKWADLSWPSRIWQWILWITIRNGHQPLRAIYGLLILWAVGFLAFGKGYQAHVMLPSEQSAYKEFAEGRALPGQYDPFCALAYAIDTSLPIISFGQRERWHPRDAPAELKQTAQPQPKADLYGILCEASFTRHGDLLGSSALATGLTVYRWFHIAIGWFLATMLIAGISGLVGRE